MGHQTLELYEPSKDSKKKGDSPEKNFKKGASFSEISLNQKIAAKIIFGWQIKDIT